MCERVYDCYEFDSVGLWLSSFLFLTERQWLKVWRRPKVPDWVAYRPTLVGCKLNRLVKDCATFAVCWKWAEELFGCLQIIFLRFTLCCIDRVKPYYNKIDFENEVLFGIFLSFTTKLSAVFIKKHTYSLIKSANVWCCPGFRLKRGPHIAMLNSEATKQTNKTQSLDINSFRNILM